MHWWTSNRQLHFTILTVWINTWGLNEFILVSCSSEVLTGLNRLKKKQTNKKKKVESDEQTELVKQLHPPSVQTVHLAWGTGIFVPSTKTPSSQLFSTLQSHCRLQRGWLKRKGKGLSGTLLLYKAFLPTDYLIWMLTDYNYQKKNIAIYQ